VLKRIVNPNLNDYHNQVMSSKGRGKKGKGHKNKGKKTGFKLVAADKIYRCPHHPKCERWFYRESGLTDHIRDFHNREVPPIVDDLLNPENFNELPKKKNKKKKKKRKRDRSKESPPPHSQARPPQPKRNSRNKPKKPTGGQREDMPHDAHSRAWRMKRVIEFQKVEKGQRTKWLKKRRIPSSDMYRWEKKLPEWIQMTEKELSKHKTHPSKGIGKFPEMEELLHKKFLERRADGWRVHYDWLSANMKILCEKHKPDNYDPSKDKFKSAWVRRYCKRKNISLRKKGNGKCSSIFERLHQIKNYDKWLLYHWQDPNNFDDPYFDYETFVEKTVNETSQDGDPDETGYEMEVESDESSII